MKSILMKLFIIGLCVSFLPIQAIAEGQTEALAIDWVHQRQCKVDKGFEVRFTADHANPDGCSNAIYQRFKCCIETFDFNISTPLNPHKRL